MKILTTCFTVILSGATMLAQGVPPERPRGPRGFRGQALHEHLQLTEEISLWYFPDSHRRQIHWSTFLAPST